MHVCFGALDVVVQVVPEHEELVESFLPAGSWHHVLSLYREFEEMDISAFGCTYQHSRIQLSRVLLKTSYTW